MKIPFGHLFFASPSFGHYGLDVYFSAAWKTGELDYFLTG
jgi:hypothetical protein